MPYKDYLEFERFVISKNPLYEKHSATGSDKEKVMSILKEKLGRSRDFNIVYDGITACRKNGTKFEFKCGDGKTGFWDSVSNIFDFSQEIDLPNEDWSKGS